MSMTSVKDENVLLQEVILSDERVKIIGQDFAVENIHPKFFAGSQSTSEETEVESSVGIGAAVEAGIAIYPKVFTTSTRLYWMPLF